MQQTTTHIQDDLQEAINEIYLWVKDGCPAHSCLDTCVGICSNVSWISCYESGEVNELLFGEDEYPFNNENLKYFEEDNKFTNHKRLAWLLKHQTVA